MKHDFSSHDDLCQACHTTGMDLREHPEWADKCPGPMPEDPDFSAMAGNWIDLKRVLLAEMAHCDWQPPGATEEDITKEKVEKAAYARLMQFVLAQENATTIRNCEFVLNEDMLERLRSTGHRFEGCYFSVTEFPPETDIVTTEIRPSRPAKHCECGATACRSNLHYSWCPATVRVAPA